MSRKRKHKKNIKQDELKKDVTVVDEYKMSKHEITDEIISCLVDNNINTKETNEICFAVMYHVLMDKENAKILKEKMGIDILQLKGNDLVDFVHAMNKTFVQLKDDFSNIHQLVGEDK
ncbi:hypothetical protein [Peptostreptococcus sp.]|uniref:hypothetical protein n=1 Tax=Peptostreptococcus sp. TaxID=1262 RepID=UPI001DB48AA5|nr:hypothetical protein [Peptostreptococcus sp.]MBS5596612.1 hypothetical protein [Peptostreptococcus sp.]